MIFENAASISFLFFFSSSFDIMDLAFLLIIEFSSQASCTSLDLVVSFRRTRFAALVFLALRGFQSADVGSAELTRNFMVAIFNCPIKDLRFYSCQTSSDRILVLECYAGCW